MNNSSEILYTLALKSCTGIGNATAKKLIENFGSAKLAFQADWKKEFPKSITLNKVNKDKALELAEKELELLEKQGIQILKKDQNNYPNLLKECNDAPLLLFGKGNFDFNSTTLISIVGTRKCTAYGLSFVEELMEFLNDYAVTIVSGLAFGIDIASHKAAMKHGIPTMAVLGNSFFQPLYPREHQKEALEMQQKGGILTEFLSSEPTKPQNFLRRNRIVAGISRTTLVIESAEKGGSLTTARNAFDYNRDVFALPGRISDQSSKGCNQLIQNNIAGLLKSPEELVKTLGLTKKTALNLFSSLPKDNPPEAKQNISTPSPIFNNPIIKLIAENPKIHIDSLAEKLQTPTHKLTGELLNLELEGRIKQLSGKLFEII